MPGKPNRSRSRTTPGVVLSKVFGNHRQGAAQPLPQGGEERVARRRAPPPDHRGGSGAWDLIREVQADDVADAYGVEPGHRREQSEVPRKAGATMRRTAIVRVAPALAGRAELVWWDTGDDRWGATAIKSKQAPEIADICRVQGSIGTLPRSPTPRASAARRSRFHCLANWN